MSLLTPDALALLQAEAHHLGRAVPATARRHVRVAAPDAPGPLVLVPLGLAGEDGALLAVGVSRAPGDLEVLVCPEPRDRHVQIKVLRDLAARLCAYLDPLAADQEELDLGSWKPRATRLAPQVVVPAPSSATLLQRVAERLVWHRPDEEGDARDPLLTRAGGWLWFLTERRELLPLDGLLLVATEVQLHHWVPPISSAEGAHLLALDAALAPPRGLSAVEAARAVEAEAGAALTSPELDRDQLEPAIEAYNRARRERAPASKLERLERAVGRVVEPVVARLAAACHGGLARLRALPAIHPVEPHGRRTLAERLAVARFASYLAQNPRFARADPLRRGLALMDDAEREVARVAREARWHDRVVRAVASTTGEALDGAVVQARTTTIVKRNAVQRLELVVDVPGPWRPVLEADYELVDDEGGLTFSVEGVTPLADGRTTRVTLRSSDQVRRALALQPTLRPGLPVAFVLHEQEFPPLPVPRTDPWMLAPQPTGGASTPRRGLARGGTRA